MLLCDESTVICGSILIDYSDRL